MTTKTNTNNRQPRKSLGEQIDRLERVLGGLHDGVAAAVQESVGLAAREAVQGVFTELLASDGATR